MHFTWKKHTNPAIRFGEQTITPRSELRWIGLWLDPKLSSSAHIVRMKQKGLQKLGQLSRLKRCYWVSSPKETRKPIDSVLRPRVLFGSVARFNTRTEARVTKIVDLLQYKANSMILGTFRNSRKSQVTHNANTITFKDLAMRAHHQFIYSRLTAPPDHPTRGI